MVHDAVRPFCRPEMVRRILESAWIKGSAVAGMPATETIQRVSDQGMVLETPHRRELYAIQTPQAFRTEILKSALEISRERMSPPSCVGPAIRFISSKGLRTTSK